MLKQGKMVLRHLKLSDASDYYSCHDKEAKKNFWSVPKTFKDAKAEVKEKITHYSVPRLERQRETFAIIYDGEFAGFISLHDIRYKHKAVTGSLVHPRFRSKGIGTKAHKIILKYAFSVYRLKRVVGHVRVFNKASARMLEKSGYRLEGRLRKDHFQNGKYFDNLVYGCVR
ncbi:MAG: GNAT family protein [archaeon]